MIDFHFISSLSFSSSVSDSNESKTLVSSVEIIAKRSMCCCGDVYCPVSTIQLTYYYNDIKLFLYRRVIYLERSAFCEH